MLPKKKMFQCIKSIQRRSFPGPYFPVFGPEKTLYLDIFHAVFNILPFQSVAYIHSAYLRLKVVN